MTELQREVEELEAQLAAEENHSKRREQKAVKKKEKVVIKKSKRSALDLTEEQAQMIAKETAIRMEQAVASDNQSNQAGTPAL